MVDIRNLIYTNLEPYKSKNDTGSRPEVLVYGASAEKTLTSYDATGLNARESNGAKIFFANGGVKLKFTKSALPTTASSLFTKDLLNNVVIINLGTANTYTEDDFKNAGIYKKIIIEGGVNAPTTSKSFTAYKLLSKADSGEEFSIGAYLSKLKVYNESSVKDYSMTLEKEITTDLSSKVTASSDLVDIKYNFEMQIGSNFYNIGGNCTDGSDLVNNFVSIVLQQTTTNVLALTLSAKVKGQAGLSAIRTAISSELDKYVSSGFLQTNKVWSDNDLIIESPFGGSDEVVISKNTPLSSGYHIHLFKLSSDERKAYAFLILPTSKGIRYIKLDGYTL